MYKKTERSLSLKITEIQKSDTKRGWVRINENSRGSIKLERVYRFKTDKGSVYRRVLGINKTGEFQADLYTRKKLDVKPGDQATIKYKCACWPELWFRFYWRHPDYPFRAAYRLAWILGGLSVLFGVWSLYLSFSS